jgi:hypothetical protein
MKLKPNFVIIIGLLLVFLLTGSAIAERYVVVNGQRLTIHQIQYLEQVACGPIANGRYWLDGRTGIWGFAGDRTPRGRITGNCGYQNQRRPSLSERGMLFSTHDWLR